MATIIRADGKHEPLTEPSCANLQEAVGGYLEAVRTASGAVLYINEEGKLYGLPLNVEATLLTAGQLTPGDFIVGDAVLLTLAETRADEGEEEV
jgi:hypothetical protein